MLCKLFYWHSLGHLLCEKEVSLQINTKTLHKIQQKNLPNYHGKAGLDFGDAIVIHDGKLMSKMSCALREEEISYFHSFVN